MAIATSFARDIRPGTEIYDGDVEAVRNVDVVEHSTDGTFARIDWVTLRCADSYPPIDLAAGAGVEVVAWPAGTHADSGRRVDPAEYEAAIAGLAEAGVKHAQLRAHYAEAVLTALAHLRPALCPDSWDEQTTCALPPHRGWHASAPRLDSQGHPVVGATWTPHRNASDFRVAR